MAWVTNEKVAQVRADLKKEFPEIKFRVNKGKNHHSTLYVTIVSAPYRFISEGTKYTEINHYGLDENTTYLGAKFEEAQKQNPSAYLERREYAEKFERVDILERIVQIMSVGNFDKSDIMTDYFHVGFYMSLSIGSWDKPFQYDPTKPAKTEPVVLAEDPEEPEEHPEPTIEPEQEPAYYEAPDDSALMENRHKAPGATIYFLDGQPPIRPYYAERDDLRHTRI